VVESVTRPQLVDDLAAGLSRFLGVPVAGRYEVVDPDVAPGQGAMNSAQRVAAVRRRYALRLDVPASQVLLVDDRTATGWTLTCAAADLRAAGADAVHPLVLASAS
jgi:ATP-dependent DNA helicase RecQ